MTDSYYDLLMRPISARAIAVRDRNMHPLLLKVRQRMFETEYNDELPGDLGPPRDETTATATERK